MLRVSVRLCIWLITHFILTLDELRIEMVATYVTRYQLSSPNHLLHQDEISSNILRFLVPFNTNAHLLFIYAHRLHAGENGFVGLQLLASVEAVRNGWANEVEPLVVFYLSK